MKLKIFLLVFTLILFAGCTSEEGEAGLSEKMSDLKVDTSELLEQNLELQSDIEYLKQKLSDMESIVSLCVEKTDETDGGLTISKDKEPPDTKALSLLETYSYDVINDRENERISLYTSAAVDGRGNIMWDDGQRFVLDVESGSGHYTLFDEYVQLGRVYFMVGDRNGGHVITVVVSTSAGMRMEEMSSSVDEAVFKCKTLYESYKSNIVFSTMPWD